MVLGHGLFRDDHPPHLRTLAHSIEVYFFAVRKLRYYPRRGVPAVYEWGTGALRRPAIATTDLQVYMWRR